MKENNFKFKKSYFAVIRDLSDKQAGELIKGICSYVFDGKPFQTKDGYLKGLFLYIKHELDLSAMNAANGKKGAEKLAESKRTKRTVKDFDVLIEGVMIATGGTKKGTGDE